MTIADEPDEGADSLDDDAPIDAYLDAGTPKKAKVPARDSLGEMPEWPPATMREVGLTVDTATLKWFRNNHADWRREMGYILRAWVAVRTGGPGPAVAAAAPTVDAPTAG